MFLKTLPGCWVENRLKRGSRKPVRKLLQVRDAGAWTGLGAVVGLRIHFRGRADRIG